MDFLNKSNVAAHELNFKRGYHLYPNENIVRIVKTFFQKGGKVLDYGFGPGENLIHLLKLGFECSGIEVSEEAKRITQEKLLHYPEFNNKYDLNIINHNDKSLPFENDSFDYILANQSLYYIASEMKIKHLLKEFDRILKPKGKLVITMLSRLNEFCTNGIKVEENVYRYKVEASGLEYLVYILRDENHIKKVFNIFNINEVGWFDNYYFGVSGHHFVILASKE